MKRANFEPVFSQKTDYCERTSKKRIKTFIPGQAMSLKELVSRFERGQRLNVHQNFKPMSNFTEDTLYEESFGDAPPDDVHDVVDVHRYYKEHTAHKRDYEHRKKQKGKKEAPVKEASDEPAPAKDPADS